MPNGHRLFDDSNGPFHDIQQIAQAVSETGAFVGHRYFGVPTDRAGVFYRFDLRITDPARWRRDSGGRRLAIRLSVLPARIIGNVPRTLDFRCEVLIDDTPCCAGSASLVFLAPVLHGNYIRLSRGAALALVHRQELPRLPEAPAEPAAVGRRDPHNVVVGEPADAGAGRLAVQVRVPERHAVFPVATESHTPGLLLLEALRQTSLLAASRIRGLPAERSTLSSIQAHFRGYAEPDMPLRCTAVPGELGEDAAGRPFVPVTLTLSQQGRAVTEAATAVLQDF
ncbi:AfsA-related hotdog domain-containing protein [Streptomyces sp. E11-3]|uniref:AfsA-related hotdog domain-containing protein n=1 Tax=Streptomyces sp. E11-3 TaxID=3110112 RepID=UPI0039814CFA